MSKSSTIGDLHTAYIAEWRARSRKGRVHRIATSKVAHRVFKMIIRDETNRLVHKFNS